MEDYKNTIRKIYLITILLIIISISISPVIGGDNL